jgi:hypothetical protein
MEILTLISCKHAKHTTMKKSINSWTQMIPTLDKIIEKLQQRTKTKFPRKETICKNKWNSLNFDYKFYVDYHKRTMNHTCFWDLLFEDKKMFHLPCQFNKKFYEWIEAFQGSHCSLAWQEHQY